MEPGSASHAEDRGPERVLKAAEALFARARIQAGHGARDLPGRAGQRGGGQLPLRRQARALPRGPAVGDRRHARDDRGGAARPARAAAGRAAATLHRHLPAPAARAGHDTVHQLFHREMHDPTPALDAIVEQAIRPRIEYLSGVVARMIGCDPSDDAVLRWSASIQAQAIVLLCPIRSPPGSALRSSRRGADRRGRGAHRGVLDRGGLRRAADPSRRITIATERAR